ncbi:hypothetical protein ACA910_022013 [Epithemia clementina (nom. ined.)]
MSFFSFALKRLSLAEMTPRYSAIPLLQAAVGNGVVTRSLSSFHGSVRAYPSYSVVAETCIMSIKLIPPQFRLLRSNILTLDNAKRGRLLVEFTPRIAGGSPTREKDKIRRFALSAEEVGFLLHQLPGNPVDFSRKAPKEYIGETSHDAPEEGTTEHMKVFRMVPGDSGIVTFSIENEFEGQEGAQQPSESHTDTDRMAVIVQLGEFEVMREIMRSTIPLLTGWSTMTDIYMQRQFDIAKQNFGRDNYSHNYPPSGGGGYEGGGGMTY